VGPSESIGEVGILAPDRLRNATVTADTIVSALFWHADDVRTALQSAPNVRSRFEELAQELERSRFLKDVAPFASLDADQRRELARRVETRSLEEGKVLFRQGEMGEECYLVRSGRIQIVRRDGGDERDVALAGPGTVLGESSILTLAPRTATGTAVEPVQVLVLPRAALEATLGTSSDTERRVHDLVRLRHRPTRVAGVEVHELETAEGDAVAVLKEPLSHRYFRLSRQGLFVWNRLDGSRNVKDLALEYMQVFSAFAPDAIADLLMGLARNGFIESGEGEGADGAGPPAERRHRFTGWAYRFLTWRRELPSLDRLTDALDRHGGKLLFTPVAQVVLLLIALAGPVAVALNASEVGNALRTSDANVIWVLLLGFFVSPIVHDAGHALATKHYGREVRGGIGFFWFSPILYVDTSDMWLAPRRQRVIVTLAGPYAGIVFGSLAALATFVVDSPLLLIGLWELALFAYAESILNLCPLLELDGYYLLVHLLDKPNLRRRSLAFLHRTFPRVLHDRSVLRGHGLEVAYGVASLLFVALLALYTVVMFRLGIEPLLRHVASDDASRAAGWVLGLLVIVIATAGAIGDLQRAEEEDPHKSSE
jgi:putative peptide zinc metalloprotease protein